MDRIGRYFRVTAIIAMLGVSVIAAGCTQPGANASQSPGASEMMEEHSASPGASEMMDEPSASPSDEMMDEPSPSTAY